MRRSVAGWKVVRSRRGEVPRRTPDKPSTTGRLPGDNAGGKSGGTPSLVTQFAPPSPPFGLVERERLLERLERGLAEPVTLVCGPAGSGKTALLSSALGAAG